MYSRLVLYERKSSKILRKVFPISSPSPPPSIYLSHYTRICSNFHLQADGENINKLEKADILELTVRHLKRISRLQDPVQEAHRFQVRHIVPTPDYSVFTAIANEKKKQKNNSTRLARSPFDTIDLF